MKKLLYLASIWPEPASSAAGTRSLQVLNLFLEEPWQITLMSAAEKRPHSAPLPDGIQTRPLLLNDRRMDSIFSELNPDAVFFDRFMIEEQYGWRIAAACPEALRIVDSIDLHSLREIRHRALKQKRERNLQDWFSDIAMRELASIYRSDLTLLISDAEFEILTNELNLPPSLLTILPFLLTEPEQHLRQDTPDFSQRKDFVSIGNFRHPPNADSVRFLHQEIWPRLQANCPEAHLKIYGADLTPALKQLHQPEKGFHVCGRAESALATLSKARVCLAPLRFGAGLKGKLLDAMLAGTPSVTTPIGAEGMQGSFDWPGAVEAEPDAFVDAATTLYQQPEIWKSAQNRIPSLLKGRFDKSSLAPPFMKKIHQLTSEPRKAHADQLTGALLRHHQHRSTEYMSRWIEAKNTEEKIISQSKLKSIR